MFRRLVEWTLSLINVSQELDRHRAAIRDLSARNRDLEEAFKLLSQEIRHLHELGAAEREKLLLEIEGIVGNRQPALPKKRRKKVK